MSLFWLWAALSAIDPCKAAVESPIVSVDQQTMEVSVWRKYGIPWAVCAEEKGAPPALLRISARDESGSHVLLEKPVDLPGSLREGSTTLYATAAGCRDQTVNHRDKTAVMMGPAGMRRWYNRRTIEVELVASGALAPLAFKLETEVYCRACDDDDSVSISYYINDFDKHTARLVVSMDRSRHECAKGGGRMILRRLWADPNVEEWSPLEPYEVVENLQEKLKPEQDKMSYEVLEPLARFCKAGKRNLFEVVGIDEYATIIRHHYGPSDAIHRGGIEFLKCKE